jgi:hypothetical protein
MAELLSFFGSEASIFLINGRATIIFLKSDTLSVCLLKKKSDTSVGMFIGKKLSATSQAINGHSRQRRKLHASASSVARRHRLNQTTGVIWKLQNWKSSTIWKVNRLLSEVRIATSPPTTSALCATCAPQSSRPLSQTRAPSSSAATRSSPTHASSRLWIHLEKAAVLFNFGAVYSEIVLTPPNRRPHH